MSASTAHTDGGEGMKKRDKQKGSITLELCLIFPLYIVVIMFILNMMNVYYLHSVVQQGLNNAAKALAQYCYLVDKTGYLDTASGWFTMEADTSQRSIGLQSSIGEITDSAQSIMTVLNDGVTLNELLGIKDEIGNFASALEAAANEVSQIKMDNIKDFIISEAANGGTGLLAGVMVNAYINDMRLDLKGIEIDYTNSKFLYGANKEITLVATYTYDRLFLLDFGIDDSVEVVQMATARPWIGDQSGGVAAVPVSSGK